MYMYIKSYVYTCTLYLKSHIHVFYLHCTFNVVKLFMQIKSGVQAVQVELLT